MVIDWTAAGAIATALAALVALLPIFTASAARKAKARNLRIRVIVKLSKLRPRFGTLIVPPSFHKVPEHAIIPDEGFKQTIAELEMMLKESEVLSAREQDALSQAIANLELMQSSLYSKEMSKDCAKAAIQLIDKAIETLEKQAIMKHEPYQPWKETSKANAERIEEREGL